MLRGLSARKVYPFYYKNRLYKRKMHIYSIGLDTPPKIERLKSDQSFKILGEEVTELHDNNWTLWWYPKYV